MVTPELKVYISEQLQRGVTQDGIRVTLKGEGWNDDDINEAITEIQNPQTHSEVPDEASMHMSVKNTEIQQPTPDIVKSSPQAQNTHSLLKWVVIVISVLTVSGGGVFAYTQGWVPFVGGAPYDRDDVVAEGFAKIADIESATHTFTGLFEVQPRDTDAEPFEYNETELDKLRPLYRRDKIRMDVMKSITQQLTFKSEYPSASELTINIPDDVEDSVAYTRTGGGSGYKIDISFETDDAIDALIEGSSWYSSGENAMIVNGKTVAITQDSYVPFYFSFTGEPPKPLLVDILEGASTMVASIPDDTRVEVSLSGASQTDDTGEIPEGELSVSVDLDLGDSSMSFDVDSIFVDKTAYFKVNKFPGLILFLNVSAIKGQWVKIDTEDAFSFVGTNPEDQKELQDSFVGDAQKAVEILIQENVLIATDGPIQDDVGENTAYRYGLAINREGVLGFANRYLDEVLNEGKNSDDYEENKYFYDSQIEAYEDAIELFESDDFNEMFDYASDNMSMDVWFSKQGFPIKFEYKIRLVPIGDHPNINKSQFVTTATFLIENINKPITVDAPDEFITIEEAEELVLGGSIVGESLKTARGKATDASIKSNLGSMRASAELYYDSNNNSYGPALEEGSCLSDNRIKQSIFGDEWISSTLTSIKDTEPMNALCAASSGSYAIAVSLIAEEGQYYCVDSSGSARVLLNTPEEDIILGNGTKSSPYACGF